jgi:hypothetical protein
MLVGLIGFRRHRRELFMHMLGSIHPHINTQFIETYILLHEVTGFSENKCQQKQIVQK